LAQYLSPLPPSPSASSKLLALAKLLSLTLCFPGSLQDWQMVYIFAVIPLIVNEIEKLFTRMSSKDEN
jgi:uncharacterized membrane protein